MSIIIVSIFWGSYSSPRSAENLEKHPPPAVGASTYRLDNPPPGQLHPCRDYSTFIQGKTSAENIYKSSMSIQLMHSQSTSIIPALEKTSGFAAPLFLWELAGKPKCLPLFLLSPPGLPAISHSWSRTISESDHWRTFRAKSTENICII